MFRVAIVSQQDPNTRTLFAATPEWLRLVEHLKQNKKVSLARLILSQIDDTKEMNSVKLPRSTANALLHESGVSY